MVLLYVWIGAGAGSWLHRLCFIFMFYFLDDASLHHLNGHLPHPSFSFSRYVWDAPCSQYNAIIFAKHDLN
jgi:hypothetical protein